MVPAHRKVSLSEIANDPRTFSSLAYEDLFAIARADIEAIYEVAIPRAFSTLRPKIRALDVLATEVGVDRIDRLNDIVRCFSRIR